MSVLNWELRRVLPELRPEGRLNVLTSLLLHANIRCRAYPTMNTISDESGFEMEAVVAAKRWLASRGAFVLVPYKYRVEEERKLPPRQHVYQLTGVIRDVNGVLNHYLYMTPEASEAIAQALESIKVSPTEISVGKVSVGETKGSYSFEGSSLDQDGSSSSSESRARVFLTYENKIGTISANVKDEILAAIDECGEAWVIEAIGIAFDKKKRFWGYADGILKSWRRDGKDASTPDQTLRKPATAPAPKPQQPHSPFRIKQGDLP